MENSVCMSCVLMGLLLLVPFGCGQDLNVSVTTIPPSPPFHAATWIKFACHIHSSGINVTTFNWTVYCTHNQPPGQPRLVRHYANILVKYLNLTSLRLKSTARSCYDTVVCSTRDTATGSTGQATWKLGIVTGVGFWGSAVPIENNSALVADSSGQIGTLYCHSSSNVTNAGRWFSPDGSDITTNFADSFEIEFYSGDGYPSYSTIKIIGQDQFTSNDQGAYSCTAPDNNGVDQTAVIWIYPNDYQGSLQVSTVGRTSVSPLALHCDTIGLPPTLVLWTKGSFILSSGPIYQLQQTRASNFAANFTNELVIKQSLHDAQGVYSCTMNNNLHQVLVGRDPGPQKSVVKIFFGVYLVGTVKIVTCNVKTDSVTQTQWETRQGLVVTRKSWMRIIANDSIHDTQFHCHGYNTAGKLVVEELFKVIVNVPDSILVAMATSTEPNAILGREYSVTCLAAITTNTHALLCSPVPSFNYENGSRISFGSNSESVTVQGPVNISNSAREVELVFDLLKTSHAGRYVCRASLDSPALDETLVKESVFQLNLQMQSLLVSVNGSTEIIVLDVSPHNVISISCLATDQDNTTVGTKSFAWFKQDTKTLLATSLEHNDGAVSITSRDNTGTTSTSMLTTTETQAAMYLYTCVSTQMTLDGTTMLASGSASVFVTVKGASNPVQPSGLSAIVLGFSSARIEWTVPSISYTRETHSVVYGFNQQHLNGSGTAVTGTSYLSSINQVYITNLTNLEEGRIYYYRVRSMNTVGRMSQSDIGSFEIEDSPIITSLRVSDPSISPIAGQTFTLICESVERVNTNGFPTVMWFDAQGSPVSSDGLSGPIYISTSQPDGTRVISRLEFRPLKASFSQEYTCEINFSSIGVIKTHSYDLQVIVQTIPVRVRTSDTAFLAAYPQKLSCDIYLGQGGKGIVQPIGDVTYTWTSTCEGSCFVNGQTNQSISTLALRAVDSGVHTCSVMDSVGNIGNGSIEIKVTGVGMYSPLVGVLSNNSLTVATNGGLETIYCISGSTKPEVGRWIAPNGEDFTEPGNHPFNAVHGGTNNPGVLEISLTPQGRFTSSEWLGVYSCVIPDEENTNRIIHVGIHTSAPPAVSILTLKASSSALYPAFIVNCTSTGSVATIVNWFKSGQLLSSGILYEMVQILRDGVTSTYDNLLLVYSPVINELTGEYRCEVSSNLAGSPAVRDAVLYGVRFSNHEIIKIGSTVSIGCSSDFGVTSTEWLYNGQVIESAEGAEAVLVIESVSDVLHDREYTCRAISRFGIEERSIRILVKADPDELSINITPSQTQPHINQSFSLTCTVVKATGLSGTPIIEWYDAVGNLFVSTESQGGVSIETDIGNGPTYTSTLSFANLEVSHSGEFTCRSQITTPAIPGIINTTADWYLIVTVQPEICTKMFQLLLSDVRDCQSYRYTDQESKIRSMIDSIVGSVNELGLDNCTSCRLLSVNEIVQPTFDCDSRFPLSVLFRAKITGSGICEEVLTAITNWVSSGHAAITANFNTLRANENCMVEIESVDTQFPQCDVEATDPPLNYGQTQGDTVLSVSLAVGAMVIVLLFVTAAIIIAVICFRQTKRCRKVPVENDGHYDNPVFSIGTESYGKFVGGTPYYYATGPGQTNSMIPLTRTGFRPHVLPKLPSPDELMSSMDSMETYVPMHSASVQQGSTFVYSDFTTENDEQLYAEIPANYNGGEEDGAL